jgi:myo-inositol-1(or 4)-monophosphatase
MKKVLSQALEEAAVSLRRNYNKSLVISVKENPSSIVTNADLESEKIIMGIIKEAYPGHNIISEEYGFINNGSDTTWIIDPLDGTSNFAAHIPWFGVLIAVLKDNEPVHAAACLPVQQDIYYAKKGAGCFKNGERINATSNSNLREMLVAFSTDYTGDKASLERGMEILKKLVPASRNIRNTNSLIDFLYVAEGKFGACVNMNTKIWDIAAPALLIEEAGGYMTGLNGHNIRFVIDPKGYAVNYPVITASCALKESLMAILRQPSGN